MAKSKGDTIDPIAKMPSLNRSAYAMVDFIADAPYLCAPDPLHVVDGPPNPSEHPNKDNPGVVRYFGSDA